MSKSFKIAACYCVYNEESFIEYSIKSIYGYVDIIIVCFGNTWRKGLSIPRDNTIDVVKSINDKDHKIKITLCQLMHGRISVLSNQYSR
jgi:hypothetical protein